MDKRADEDDLVELFIDYLRTDEAFEVERTRAVPRKRHEQHVWRMLAKAIAHVCLKRKESNQPLDEEGKETLKAIVCKAWTERKQDICDIVPIWEETTLGIH